MPASQSFQPRFHENEMTLALYRSIIHEAHRSVSNQPHDGFFEAIVLLK